MSCSKRGTIATSTSPVASNTGKRRADRHDAEIDARSLLVNLASNAAKFTREGSIELVVLHDHDRLIIEVRDTGIGVPLEARKLIFDAFRQVHQGLGVGGTGLGLSIVSHLVELLGGQVELESEVGRGSTFRVAFERVAQRGAA